MEFDDVFDHIGHMELYQILLFIVLGLISMINCMQSIGINFVGAHQVSI